MAVKKITLSLPHEIYKEFKKLAVIKGFSISAWVAAKMREEINLHENMTELKVYELLNKLDGEELEEIYAKYL